MASRTKRTNPKAAALPTGRKRPPSGTGLKKRVGAVNVIDTRPLLEAVAMLIELATCWTTASAAGSPAAAPGRTPEYAKLLDVVRALTGVAGDARERIKRLAFRTAVDDIAWIYEATSRQGMSVKQAKGFLRAAWMGSEALRITLAPAGEAEFLKHFTLPLVTIRSLGGAKKAALKRVGMFVGVEPRQGVTLYNQSALSFRPPFGAAPSDRARATTVIEALFPDVNAAAAVQAVLGSVAAEREDGATTKGFGSSSAIFWPSEASLHALDAAKGRAARARALAAIFDRVPGDWVGGAAWSQNAVFGQEGSWDADVEAEYQKWLKETEEPPARRAGAASKARR